MWKWLNNKLGGLFGECPPYWNHDWHYDRNYVTNVHTRQCTRCARKEKAVLTYDDVDQPFKGTETWYKVEEN